MFMPRAPGFAFTVLQLKASCTALRGLSLSMKRLSVTLD